MATETSTPEFKTGEDVDFSTLIISLASAALMGMGLAKNPATGKVEKDIKLARQNIDLLALLKDKTKNNLSNEEERLIEALLYDTRMRYVEITKEESDEKR